MPMTTADKNGHTEEANTSKPYFYWLLALAAVLLLGAYYYGKHEGRNDYVPKAKLDKQIKKSERELTKQCNELQLLATNLLRDMARMKEKAYTISPIEERLEEASPDKSTTQCFKHIVNAEYVVYKYYSIYNKVNKKCVDPYPDQYPREYTMDPGFQLECRLEGVKQAKKKLGKKYKRIDNKIERILYIDCVETVLHREANEGFDGDSCSRILAFSPNAR